MITLSCIECGKKFEAQRTSAKFCSANCRVKWNNKEESTEPPTTIPSLPKTIEKPKSVNVADDTPPEQQKKIDETIAKIKKDFGEDSIGMASEMYANKLPPISTGSITLDRAIGIGGLPRGRFVEIYGYQSSGKTSIALSTIAEAQKNGLKCAFIDAEHSFDKDYAALLGINVNKLVTTKPTFGEEALEDLERLVLTAGYAVIVVDSIAALIPKGELEGEMGDSKIGLQARLMSQACRKLVASISRTNTLVIFLNQIRANIGNIYQPTVVTGGQALNFYASVRLQVARISDIKDGEEKTGYKVRVTVVKSKVSSPWKKAEFDMIYGEGIDKIGEIVDMAVFKNVIQKAGSWYSYNSDKLGQGRDSVRQLLKDNDSLLQEIKTKIL